MPRPVILISALLVASALAFQTPPAAPPDHVANPFATGWMLVDTNGEGIADFIAGKIVVPDSPTAVENAAAANLAARLAYGSTGMTPPVVVDAAHGAGAGPRIRIVRQSSNLPPLEKEAGGAFASRGDLLILGDDAGLTAVSDAYSARAPYQWRVSGETLSAIAEVVRAAAPGVAVELA